jgi:hypothetical protein
MTKPGSSFVQLIKCLPIILGVCAFACASTPAAAAVKAPPPSISIATPCVIFNPTMATNTTITGSGFTAGDNVTFESTLGGAYGDASVNTDGTFTGTFTAASVNAAEPVVSTFTMKATDDDGVSASATFLEAPLAVDTVPARAKPTTRATINVSGFTSGASVYAHYLHGKKLVTTKRFGIAQGPCGLLSEKTTLFPANEKYASYTVQLDDTAKYSSKSTPKLTATLSKTSFRLDL